MRNINPLLGATTLIGAIATAYLWQQLAATTEVARNLQARLTAAESGQNRQPLPTAIVPGSGAVQTAQAASAGVEGPQGSTEDMAPGLAPDSGRTTVISSVEMVKDPVLRESMATSIRAALPQRYPYLAEDLNLTAEQTSKLHDQLAEHQLQLLGTGPDPEKREQLSRSNEAAIASLLGATTYNQWKDYQETLDVRQQVGQLDNVLQSTAQPLSKVQRRQMTAAMATYQKQLDLEAQPPSELAASASAADKTAFVEARLQGAEEQNEKLRGVAASYLTPEQLEAFVKMQNQASAVTRAMLRTQQGQRPTGTD
jgi:hypothetical protein